MIAKVLTNKVICNSCKDSTLFLLEASCRDLLEQEFVLKTKLDLDRKVRRRSKYRRRPPRRLGELEKKQRKMHEAVAFSIVMLNETLEDADVDMDEVEELEGCLAASVLAMVYRAPESTAVLRALNLVVTIFVLSRTRM